MTWHLLTGEYPPQPGGVSDYTRQVARALAAAGDRVHVWAPPSGAADAADAGVTVHRLPDRFGPRSLRALTPALAREGQPCRLLVQYVPHAFGLKGANVPFCLWLRSHRAAPVWVMFHEVLFLADGERALKRRALAAATRWMARFVAGRADRAFVSIPGWTAMLEPLVAGGTDVTWMPVPSAIPVVDDAVSVSAIRARYGAGRPLVGHFGTYGEPIRGLLAGTVRALAARSDCRVLLIGSASDGAAQAFLAADRSLSGRVFATGRLSPEDVSCHLSACDLMLQPYPDGVSARRTSAMAALSHGRAVVTTAGWLTEPVWGDEQAVALVPAGDTEALALAAADLLANPSRRADLARRGAALYDARFALRHTVAALTSAA